VRGDRVMFDPQLPPHRSDCTVSLRRDGQTIPEALSYTPRAASPMAAAPPAT
jgi:hypothetical protein